MRKLTLLFVTTVYLCSCHTPRYVYSPAHPNNPYFEKKGDGKLSVLYSGTGRSDNARQINSGYDIQGAYAIGKHWALTAELFKRKERDTHFFGEKYNIFDSSVVNYKRNLFEFGGGYFVPLTRSKNVYFHLYSGFGFGKFSFDDNGVEGGADYSRFHKSKAFKWYMQSGFNAIMGKYFRFSFLGRLSVVRYSKVSTSYTTDELQYFKLNRIKNNSLSFFEPSLNMQIGVPKCDWLKIEGGLTLCTDPENYYLEARSFNPNIGLTVDLSVLKGR